MSDAHIRWKCRRGMLELDIIFEQFYNNYFSHLTVKERDLFDKLLDEPDPILYDWLLGHQSSEGSPYDSIIKKIRQHHRS